MSKQQDPFWFEREELVGAMRWLDDHHDVVRDTHGNISMRIGTGDDFSMLIKPSGVPYSQVEPWMVPLVNSDGSFEMRGDLRKPSVDAEHHLAIYRRHPWIRAICHTHSPYATAFAVAGREIACSCTEHADYFGSDVHCAAYADLHSWGKKVSLSKGERALLLEKHGALLFGATPLEVAELAVALENVAHKSYLARTLLLTLDEASLRDSAVRPMSTDEIKKWHDRYRTSYGQ